jgi:hypothetical protein
MPDCAVPESATTGWDAREPNPSTLAAAGASSPLRPVIAGRARGGMIGTAGGGGDYQGNSRPCSRNLRRGKSIATPPTPFPVRHGQTTGSLSLGPLGPGDFSCPSGQLRFLDSVTYSNTIVTDATGNSADAQPDPITATLHIQV